MQRNCSSNPLGLAVKNKRKAKGLTQSQFALQLSISTRYLKAIENNGQKPGYNLLIKIVGELDISTDAIFRSEYVKNRWSHHHHYNKKHTHRRTMK